MFNYLSFEEDLVTDPDKNLHQPESEPNTNKEQHITKQYKVEERETIGDVKWYIKAVSTNEETHTIYTIIPLTHKEFVGVCKFLSKNSEVGFATVHIIDHGFASEEEAYKHIVDESCWIFGSICC